MSAAASAILTQEAFYVVLENEVLSNRLKKGDTMSTEENKTNARRVFDEVFNKGDLSSVKELMSTDYVLHIPGMPDLNGLEGFRQFATIERTAFPDLN